MQPKVEVRRFWLPKAGNSKREYEDFFKCHRDRWRFAVADGASESIFARQWAKLLVKGFVTEPPRDPVTTDTIEAWLSPLQGKWQKLIRDKLSQLIRRYHWESLPWFVEEKARRGAFSSLLGLSLQLMEDGENWEWKAVAVGDSCLFQVADDSLRQPYPVARSEDFGNCPVLLPSNPDYNRRLKESLLSPYSSKARSGDTFFLSTDALAQWFLSECETKKKPWTELRNLKNPPEFQEFVERLRTSRLIRNDDTTLLIVEIP